MMFNFDVILMANIICFSMVLVELALKSLLSAFILLTMKTLNVTNYNCVSVYSCCWFSLCGNGKSWCRYQSGDRLSPEHERTVVERLLPFHPEFEKKIGSGINYITVSLSLSLSLALNSLDKTLGLILKAYPPFSVIHFVQCAPKWCFLIYLMKTLS